MIWKTIPGWPDYEASEAGDIRRNGRILKPGTTCNGYRHVALCTAGKPKTHTVHRLVALTFLGPQPSDERYAVAHRDGDKMNNSASNLYWATRSDNEKDKRAHGKHNYGERHGKSILSEDDVRAIRASTTMTPQELADHYGVKRVSIYGIRKGHSWKHVR